MNVQLECPACEHRFSVAGGTGASQTCPACRRSFVAKPIEPTNLASKVDAGSDGAATAPSSGPLRPHVPAPSSIRDAAADSQDSAANSDRGSGDEALRIGSTRLGVPVFDSSRRQRHVALRLGVPATFVAMLAAVCWILIALRDRGPTASTAGDAQGDPAPTVTESPSPANSAPDATADHDPSDSPAEPANDLRATPGQGRPDPTSADAPPPTPPYVDVMPTSFGSAQLTDLWLQMAPHVVEVRVDHAHGQRVVGGFIVDSRGWIATSYSAIRDASRVQVTMAGRGLRDGPALSDATDAARGIVAIDEANDIALVAINRSLIVALSELPWLTNDLTVGGERLLAARPPPAGGRMWFEEVRVDRRRRYSEMSEDERAALTAPPAESLRQPAWIIQSHENTATWPGALLVNRDGRIVGMNSGLATAGNEALAVPISAILALRDATDNPTVQNFTGAPPLAGSPSEPGALPPMGGAVTEFENDALVTAADAYLAACGAFHFLPLDEPQYETLCALGQAIVELHRRASDRDLPRDDHEAVTDCLGRITAAWQSAAETIGSTPVERLAAINQLALARSQLESRPVVTFVDLEYAAYESQEIEGQATVVVKLTGAADTTGGWLVLPATEPTVALREGYVWMLVTVIDNQRQFHVVEDGLRQVATWATGQASLPFRGWQTPD